MRPFLSVVLQLSIISIATVQVTGDTASKNSCQGRNETLQLKIKTGDKLFAGTDDNIDLLLRSANGVICSHTSLDNWGNDRKRNNVDKYTICCPPGFVSDGRELSMLALSHILPRSKYGCRDPNDWFIESIELRAGERVLFDYRFHAWTSTSAQWVFGVTKIGNKSYTRF
jgi:hypothetical protein